MPCHSWQALTGLAQGSAAASWSGCVAAWTSLPDLLPAGGTGRPVTASCAALSRLVCSVLCWAVMTLATSAGCQVPACIQACSVSWDAEGRASTHTPWQCFASQITCMSPSRLRRKITTSCSNHCCSIIGGGGQGDSFKHTCAHRRSPPCDVTSPRLDAMQARPARTVLGRQKAETNRTLTAAKLSFASVMEVAVTLLHTCASSAQSNVIRGDQRHWVMSALWKQLWRSSSLGGARACAQYTHLSDLPASSAMTDGCDVSMDRRSSCFAACMTFWLNVTAVSRHARTSVQRSKISLPSQSSLQSSQAIVHEHMSRHSTAEAADALQASARMVSSPPS